VPLLFIVPAVIVLVLNARSGNNSPLVWLIVIAIAIALYLYAVGKALVNSGIITRLAFAELINQPETVANARSQVQLKQWTFVLTMLLLGVIFFGIFLVFGFLMIIPLLNLLLLLPALACLLWFVAKFIISDAIVAIEDSSSSLDIVGRSWDLTKENTWRIVLILLVALLITIPLQIMIQIITTGVQQALIQPVLPDAINGSTNAISTITIVYLLTLVLAYLTNAVILPLWQAIKGVIYYDLRSRREGLGLKLRDSEV
jgi:hypothetical protein